MKQIFNWTIGSFFRTIGRTLALIFIGAIIAYILSSSGIRLKFPLLSMSVSAKTGYARYETIHDSAGTRWPVVGEGPAFYYTELGNTNANQLTQIIGYYTPNGASGNNLTGGYDFAEFSFLIYGNTQYTSTQSSTITTEDAVACRRFYCNSYDTNNYCARWYCDQWYTVQDGSTSTVYDSEQYHIGLSMAVSLIRQDGIATQCEVDMAKQKIICPLWSVQKTGWNRIRIQYNLNGRSSNLPVYLGISRTIFMYDDADSVVSNSIQSQTQQQQQQHQEMMDTNTTQDSNETSTYFWSDDSDSSMGSLQGIVSTPLSLINSLTSGTSSPLCFTLNSKQTCIPDGTIIWGGPNPNSWRVFDSGFNGRTTFIAFFNLVVGGFMFYKMLLSMFRLVDDMLDPVAKGIEVMKL